MCWDIVKCTLNKWWLNLSKRWQKITRFLQLFSQNNVKLWFHYYILYLIKHINLYQNNYLFIKYYFTIIANKCDLILNRLLPWCLRATLLQKHYHHPHWIRTSILAREKKTLTKCNDILSLCNTHHIAYSFNCVFLLIYFLFTLYLTSLNYLKCV